MDLVVFDLDGTLLNKRQTITDYTRETLRLLSQRNIAYTVATGRTLHAARTCLAGVDFPLPHIYKNGVLVWQPESEIYSHTNLLEPEEIAAVLDSFARNPITPFVFTLEKDGAHMVYHTPPQTPACHAFMNELTNNRGLTPRPISELPDDAAITNISALGDKAAADAIHLDLASQEHLIGYIGGSMYDSSHAWIDIHHGAASKGDALEILKSDLGVSRIICFGDSDNDLSMFEMADEGYAPANALDEVKALATEVIEHHDQDGIARFLRSRFKL